MTKEVLESLTLKEILQNENCIFHPAGNFQIPNLQEINLLGFGEKNKDQLTRDLEEIIGFIKGNPLSDSFGNDHGTRIKWKEEMASKYGKPFLDYYREKNPMAVTHLFDTRLAIKDLADLAKSANSEMASVITEIFEEINALLGESEFKGIGTAVRISELKKPVNDFKKIRNLAPYNQIESLDEKLRIVNQVKEKSAIILTLLSSKTS